MNGQLAACSGGTSLYADLDSYPDACSYVYSPLATPNVSNVSPLQAATGDSITISGSGFSSESVTILFGDTPCSLDTWSESQIVCVLGEGMAGNKPLYLNDLSGDADTNSITLEHTISVVSINPSQGSNAGKTVITIIGGGFYPQTGLRDVYLQTICSEWENVVTIDSSQCNIITSTYTSITCTTPAATTAMNSTADVSITVQCISDNSSVSSHVFPDGFEFSAQDTPSVTSVSPTEGSSAGGDTITIGGSRFSNQIDEITVMVS